MLRSGHDARSSSDSHNGFADVIGVALLFAALLLLAAQFSFDHNDISFLTTRVNKPAHNWIGLLGAWLAYGFFSVFGVAAYLLPLLLAAFGVAYLLNILGHLRERLRWSLLWSFVLVISVTGLLFIMDDGGRRGKFHETIGSQSIGGWLDLQPTDRRNITITAFACWASSARSLSIRLCASSACCS